MLKNMHTRRLAYEGLEAGGEREDSALVELGQEGEHL